MSEGSDTSDDTSLDRPLHHSPCQPRVPSRHVHIRMPANSETAAKSTVEA